MYVYAKRLYLYSVVNNLVFRPHWKWFRAAVVLEVSVSVCVYVVYAYTFKQTFRERWLFYSKELLKTQNGAILCDDFEVSSPEGSQQLPLTSSPGPAPAKQTAASLPGTVVQEKDVSQSDEVQHCEMKFE